jgi:hypothetical protein
MKVLLRGMNSDEKMKKQNVMVMLPVFKSQTRSFKGKFIGKKRRKWNET